MEYKKANSSNLKVYVLRLKPNQDLFKELDAFVYKNSLRSGFIMTCVGSLTNATIRMAYSGLKENEVYKNNKLLHFLIQILILYDILL